MWTHNDVNTLKILTRQKTLYTISYINRISNRYCAILCTVSSKYGNLNSMWIDRQIQTQQRGLAKTQIGTPITSNQSISHQTTAAAVHAS